MALYLSCGGLYSVVMQSIEIHVSSKVTRLKSAVYVLIDGVESLID